MRQVLFHVGKDLPQQVIGLVLAHDLRRASGKGLLFRKGYQFRAEDVERLAEIPGQTLHLLQMEEGDLHEETAGLRLAKAVSGEGVRLKGYIGAQYHLVAAHRGLLHVDASLLEQVNALEGLSVFTLFHGQPVEEGELLAGVKVTPLLIEEDVIRAAEIRCQPSPPLRVDPFRSITVGVLILESIDAAMRARFEEALVKKLAWFGAKLGPMREVENDGQSFAAAFAQLRDAGVQLILAAGASSLDPLEPLFLSLRQVGATIEKHGVPVHPGSLFWVAYLPSVDQEVPVFGLSSCEMFSHRTVLDLVMPVLFTGQRVQRSDLVALGHGGLLTREMAFRFPPYGEERRREG